MNNVIITSNNNANIINNLGIDSIKNMSGEFSSEEIITSFSTFFYKTMIIDITSIRNYKNIGEIKKLATGLDPSKFILLLDNSKEVNDWSYISCLITMGIYNFTKKVEGILYLINKPNTYNDVSYLQTNDKETIDKLASENTNNIVTPTLTYDSVKIIGFRNITEHAGSTTLIYMLKKCLSKKYKVKCIELDKSDFAYFSDPEMESFNSSDINMLIPKFSNYKLLLIDLNESGVDGICNEIVYLLEPSTIKLNQMMTLNKDIFNILQGRKIVINQSLLNDSLVSDFEVESGSKIFFNLPPLDDKIDNCEILERFINLLGIIQ